MSAKAFRALANDKRLQILEWLKDPESHFPAQVDGDLVSDGVCAIFIAAKVGVSRPTASEHLRILLEADLIESKKIKQWIFYRRHNKGIASVRKQVRAVL